MHQNSEFQTWWGDFLRLALLSVLTLVLYVTSSGTVFQCCGKSKLCQQGLGTAKRVELMLNSLFLCTYFISIAVCSLFSEA